MKTLRTTEDRMSFFDHLGELRGRLVRSVIALALGFGVCFPFRKQIFEALQKPLTDALAARHMTEKLVYTSLPDPFFLYIKISFLAGIFLAAPCVIYQAWLFIAPGLYPRERKFAVPFILAASGFFLYGGYFGYRYVFPAAVGFFLDQGVDLRIMLTANNYFALCSKTLLAIAIAFEVPVVISLLALLGIVSHRFLLKHARYAVLLNFIAAAILTPTQDMVTLTMVAVPMTGLYFLSILAAWFFEAMSIRRKAASEAPPAGES